MLFLNINPFNTMPTTVKNSDLREALLGAQPNSANAGQHSVQEQAQAEDEPAARFWQTYTRKREQARRKLINKYMCTRRPMRPLIFT